MAKAKGLIHFEPDFELSTQGYLNVQDRVESFKNRPFLCSWYQYARYGKKSVQRESLRTG